MEGSDVAADAEARFRGRESRSSGNAATPRNVVARIALEVLVCGSAAAFLIASAIHFGAQIPLGFATLSDVTILPAGIAEGLIGAAFAGAAAAVFARWSWAWNGTLAAYLLGILGVLIGIGVSMTDSGDSSKANLLFHVTILPVLVAGLALILTRSGKTALGRSPEAIR